MFLFASISAGNFTNTVVFGKTNETFENTENTTEIINNKTSGHDEPFNDTDDSKNSNKTNNSNTTSNDANNPIKISNKTETPVDISKNSYDESKTMKIDNGSTGNPILVLLLAMILLPIKRRF